MIEALLEFILECLGEALLQLIAEIGLELGFESIKYKKPISPVFAIVGFIILGAFIGFVSFIIFPELIIVKHKLTGLSLVISPLCAGLALHYFGKWKRDQGKTPTYLASFWGGATFALAMVLTRWFVIYQSL